MSLPFAYFHPESEGKLTWHCNHDSQGKITSLFRNAAVEGPDSRRICYLDTVEDAVKTRDALVNDGWLVLTPPKVVTKIDGQERPLNRKEKRWLARKLEKDVRKKDVKDTKNNSSAS